MRDYWTLHLDTNENKRTTLYCLHLCCLSQTYLTSVVTISNSDWR